MGNLPPTKEKESFTPFQYGFHFGAGATFGYAAVCCAFGLIDLFFGEGAKKRDSNIENN